MAKELARAAAPSTAIAKKSGTALKNHAAKKHAVEKHAAKKHAAKKHPAKKHAPEDHAARKHAKKAAKHAAVDLSLAYSGEDAQSGSYNEREQKPKHGKHARKLLTRAFHHLQRANAVISLIEQESGGDLKILLHKGTELFREASKGKNHKDEAHVDRAFGLLAASEHLAMAGLYAARGAHQLNIEVPSTRQVKERLEDLKPRLEKTGRVRRRNYAERLQAMAGELLQRAEAADHDPHLAYELIMAADGLCTALEAGLED